MKIDITREPPADIFRGRGTYLRLSIAFLFLVACGGLLVAYGIMSSAPHSETLETAALVLIVGPGLAFVYVAEKLKAWKSLSPDQKEKLAALGRKHLEIAAYFTLVARDGREPILAELEAAEDRAEELNRKKEAAE